MSDKTTRLLMFCFEQIHITGQCDRCQMHHVNHLQLVSNPLDNSINTRPFRQHVPVSIINFTEHIEHRCCSGDTKLLNLYLFANTPSVQAFALKSSSGSCSPAPDLVLLKLVFPHVFFSGIVLFTDIGNTGCGTRRGIYQTVARTKGVIAKRVVVKPG